MGGSGTRRRAAGGCGHGPRPGWRGNPTITLDEHGVGSLVFPGGAPIPVPGVLMSDPGPGGRGSALTYNLLGPPSLVAGDLFVLEPGGPAGQLSDVIRFNPAGTGSVGYAASVVFYSDNADGVDAPADVGFPTSFYTNTFSLFEVGGEGNNGLTYTPTAGQPGYIAGFGVTYVIRSDMGGVPSIAPEPGTWLLLGTGLFAIGMLGRRTRHGTG